MVWGGARYLSFRFLFFTVNLSSAIDMSQASLFELPPFQNMLFVSFSFFFKIIISGNSKLFLPKLGISDF